MPTDHIRYDLLAQDALRGVVRRVLADAAKNGLPGEHHFYITFDTRASGLKISQRLLAQHPEEMTIVLQHQFWDLAVTDQAFEVHLSFKAIPERLLVPFDAIKGFFDPSVQFGLQFETTVSGEEATQVPPAEPALAETGGSHREKATAPQPAPKPALPARPPPGAGEPGPQPAGSKIVKLDRFRKK